MTEQREEQIDPARLRIGGPPLPMMVLAEERASQPWRRHVCFSSETGRILTVTEEGEVTLHDSSPEAGAVLYRLIADNLAVLQQGRASLATYDEAVSACPIRADDRRALAAERCPVCFATSSQGCGRDASASYAFIKETRAALSPATQEPTDV